MMSGPFHSVPKPQRVLDRYSALGDLLLECEAHNKPTYVFPLDTDTAPTAEDLRVAAADNLTAALDALHPPDTEPPALIGPPPSYAKIVANAYVRTFGAPAPTVHPVPDNPPAILTAHSEATHALNLPPDVIPSTADTPAPSGPNILATSDSDCSTSEPEFITIISNRDARKLKRKKAKKPRAKSTGICNMISPRCKPAPSSSSSSEPSEHDDSSGNSYAALDDPDSDTSPDFHQAQSD
jgi:hypothetical protein